MYAAVILVLAVQVPMQPVRAGVDVFYGPDAVDKCKVASMIYMRAAGPPFRTAHCLAVPVMGKDS